MQRLHESADGADYQLLSTYTSPASPVVPSSARDEHGDAVDDDASLNQHVVDVFPSQSRGSVMTRGAEHARSKRKRRRQSFSVASTLPAVFCGSGALRVLLLLLFAGTLLIALALAISLASFGRDDLAWTSPRRVLLKPWLSLRPGRSNPGSARGGGYRDPLPWTAAPKRHHYTAAAASKLPPPAVAAVLPRVERAASISLERYLSARFDPATTDIMWTMATASYVSSTKNWDLKRAELAMSDSVVVLCLDHACLDACEREGLYALAAYLQDVVKIPPPSGGGARLRRRMGAERGHTMAYLKFRAMLDMAKTGYFSLFFEGDTFLTANPFDHMLSRRDDTWDLQFTEDGNYLLNFGWIYARPSAPVIDLYRRALAEYISNNMWDQELLSNIVRSLGAREQGQVFSPPHWWICEENGLRVYMLPLLKFFPYHLDTYTFPQDSPEPIVNHLSSISLSNRLFYAKERGWAANINGFYTSPRTVLQANSINSTIQNVAHYARSLHVLAVHSGWSLQVPAHLTASGFTEGTGASEGFDWEYTRAWSRFVSVEPAMTQGLDLLEANFFEHAGRYLPDFMIRDWQTRNVTVDLSTFASLDQLVSHLESFDLPASSGSVVELVGYDAPGSLAATWDFDSPSVRDVPQMWREVPFCERFHMQNMPAGWCQPLALVWA